MDALRPAPASSEAGKNVPQQRAAPKKRRKAVAGGSTVLAALFCLFIYCGIGLPRVDVPTRELKYPTLVQPRALHIDGGQAAGAVDTGGRALLAADFEGGYLRDNLRVELNAPVYLRETSWYCCTVLLHTQTDPVAH